MRSALLLAGPILLALAAASSAHDYWLQPATFTTAAGKPVALSLHVGDHFASEGERAHQKKPTLSFKLLWAGKTTDLDARDGDKPMATFTPSRPGIYLVALERDARLITLEAKKFTSYLEEEGLRDIVAARKKAGEAEKDGRERYRRYLKCYLRAGGKGDESWKKKAGHKLEIVPLSDPTGMKKGDTLKVRVLFEDKALSGVQVQAFSRVKEKVKTRTQRTSADGEVSFELGESGVYLVRLVHMRRAKDDKGADWHSWWSAMTFEVR